jgi:hypothetical protein
MFHPYHQVLAWDVEPPLALATLRYIPRTPASSRAIGDSHVGFPRGFPPANCDQLMAKPHSLIVGFVGPTSSTIRGIVFGSKLGQVDCRCVDLLNTREALIAVSLGPTHEGDLIQN